MKSLLIIAPSYPFPVQDGTQLRLYNLARRFHPGVHVTILHFNGNGEMSSRPLPAPLEGVSIGLPARPRASGWRASQLAQIGRAAPGMIWKFYTPEMAAEVRQQASRADAVLAVGLQMGQYLTEVPRSMPKVLDNYNVEWLILSRMAKTRPVSRRWYWQLEAWKLRSAEQRLLRLADSVIAISDVDQAGMSALAPETRFYIVPNGVELETFSVTAKVDTGEPPRFAFVGALNWHVNEDAAIWMCEQVWPTIRFALPTAELVLVGKDPSPAVRALARYPAVRVTGTVPDVRPFIAESTALIVPLRYGSGIRNKILEGFASGRPIVTTSVGCEGLPVRDEKHLLIADDADGFAKGCVRLASDPSLGKRLATAGRQLVSELDGVVTTRFEEVWRDGLRLACCDNTEGE